MRWKSHEKRLAATLEKCLKAWEPPRDLTVDKWADQFRFLDSSISAEAGPWRTERTPYLREPMQAFTDPHVEEISMVAPSQVGKTEFELNCIGYIIDQDPSSILYVHPTLDAAREFSRERLEPSLKASPVLDEKLKDVKSAGRTAGATILMKAFPGGYVSFAGSNSANGLSSKPIRYVIADEVDRWSASAGRDGDPWTLAVKRQATFFNRKRVAVSTPVIKGQSRIEKLFYRGTQERWCTQCPHCGEFHEIRFDDIKFAAEPERRKMRVSWKIDVKGWKCPGCGGMVDEMTAKKQPAKWIAAAPENLEKNRARSFWLNGFASPWSRWTNIVQGFFEAKDDIDMLQAWKNTTLGELWERRASNIEEIELMERAEEYPSNAELPGEPGRGTVPLLLTCGVDCQHSYLQYEVVGWGRYGESWGIRSGFIQGAPDSDEAWSVLDGIISREYRFLNGKSLRITATFVDSGDGNFTNEIARRTAARMRQGVFACKGDGTQGKPFVAPAKWLPIGGNEREKYPLYVLGVNAGKSAIMGAVAVQEPGPNYMHLPAGEDRGYDIKWYSGLLSEIEEVRGASVRWVKLPGHERNEALDCRNYARAAYKAINPNFDAIEDALRGERKQKEVHKKTPTARKKSKFSAYL